MGCTVTEFGRLLPAAMRDWPVTGGPAGWRVCDARRAPLVEIRLEAMPDRRLGALCLPSSRVSIAIADVPQALVDEFTRRFERGFQRGGG